MEKGNLKLGDWAVIGLKRWTLADHVGEIKWNTNVHHSSPASTFGLCYFQYFFDTSSCLHLSLRFSPSRLIQFVCLWKKAKTKSRGKTRDSRGRIKGKKAPPPRRRSQKISRFSLPSFQSVMTPLSLFFSTHSCHFPSKISFILSTKGRACDDFRPKSPFSCSLPTSCILSLLLYSFLSSTLLLLLFFALQPSLTAVQRRQWIVFNEQRDVEQRSQRDRATQTATQFPSLIHYLHAGFHLWDDDFYFEASFISHVPKPLHLFWQKTSVFPAWLRNFLYIEDQRVEVKTSSCCSHDGWATREPGND